MSKLGNRRSDKSAAVADPSERRASRLDNFIESYTHWRERAADVAASYEGWTRSSRAERSTAYRAYRIALDREELAANVHRHCADELRLEAA